MNLSDSNVEKSPIINADAPLQEGTMPLGKTSEPSQNIDERDEILLIEDGKLGLEANLLTGSGGATVLDDSRLAQDQPINPATKDKSGLSRSRSGSISRPPSLIGGNPTMFYSMQPQKDLSLNGRFKLLPINDQIRELQTVIRDRETTRGDFKFYADRLIRLVVEEGLNQLPTEKVAVKTPTGHTFDGIRYIKGNCGVSIVRSGESMEQGLRDCCRSIRIGKILIESDENNQARVLYAKFPHDIAQRKILLLYPIMSTGLAVVESIKVLLQNGVREENLILLNLFSSPKAAKMINQTFSKMMVLTSEINAICPNHFGHRYFGTD